MLVNNAGIQNWMDVSDNNFYEKAIEEITTNVLAPVHLTALFTNLTSLKTIINVTSGLAIIPIDQVTKSQILGLEDSRSCFCQANNNRWQNRKLKLTVDLGTDPMYSDFYYGRFNIFYV